MGSYGPSIEENLIDDAIHARLELLRKSPCGREDDLPFFVADMNKIIQQHQRWRNALPGIHPFYAVKCNPDPKLLRLLADMDVNFDCASLAEIELVLSMGIDPSRIIFAHPCKAPSALDIAARRGVRWTTFDNSEELIKIQRISPKMELLLRIYAQDHTATINLSEKFGAPLEIAPILLEEASQLGLKIVGVSFHIGSGASDPNAFVKAVKHAKRVFNEGQSLGFDMKILDVGGGFDDIKFETMAHCLREAIAHEFKSRVTLIAEPGRFYASGFYTMVCQVIARRIQKRDGRNLPDMLYLNDGIYGCFSARWSENRVFEPILVQPRGTFMPAPREWKPHRYSIWGPTCDSIDFISKGVLLDQEIMTGDWLKFQDMGGKP
ncbi:Mitochondrial 2-oxoadipate and 2-oxoglutarate transporter [Penicillium hetheringtonii]|uniref:Mitochondrial 2-oxoadipate and 2-oxoglutarate transporter n=1 Tax=Penicillium hetheringtonii TaxID=911720 RepID=A0AAD6DP27_9EURO|nr:Mitochondrial 2-oxoadipate and 2-oxoglutarate transporter [Penicillium hetheringtonii]